MAWVEGRSPVTVAGQPRIHTGFPSGDPQPSPHPKQGLETCVRSFSFVVENRLLRVEEMSAFEQFHQALAGKVRFIEVNLEDDPEGSDVGRGEDRNHIGTGRGRRRRLLPVRGRHWYAHDSVGRPNGIILQQHAGPLQADELRRFIDDLLMGRAAPGE